jgi:hypothetical protein
MSDDSICATWNRLVVEGEELVLHNASSGCPDLVSVADIRERDLTHRHQHKRTLWQRIRHSLENISDGSHPVSAVWVPSGTHLIVKGIPSSIQQRYGLEEEEGAIFLRPDTQDHSSRGKLRFNNGALVQLQELRAGQLVEVLSLTGTQPALYEPVIQAK